MTLLCAQIKNTFFKVGIFAISGVYFIKATVYFLYRKLIEISQSPDKLSFKLNGSLKPELRTLYTKPFPFLLQTIIPKE